jgi:hypothetical protein
MTPPRPVAWRAILMAFSTASAPVEKERRFGRAVNRHDVVDALGQAHVFGIRHHLVATVGEALQLRRNGGLHLGVHVPGVEHGNAPGKVDEAAALDVPELGVFGVADEKVAHHPHAARRGRQAAGVPVCIGLGGGQLAGGGGCVHGRAFKVESKLFDTKQAVEAILTSNG